MLIITGRSAYCDAQLPPENLREFLPRLIPVLHKPFIHLLPYFLQSRTTFFKPLVKPFQVLVSNMAYADDDESLAEAEVTLMGCFVLMGNLD